MPECDWKTTTLNMGQYKGKTYLEVVKKNPKYIKWMYDTGINKSLVSQALNYLERRNMRADEPEAMVILLVRSNKRYSCGVLGIKISGLLTNEAFDELHFTCKTYLPEQQVWIVPVPLLGDIIARFPYAMLVGELIELVAWTPPTKLERGAFIIKPNNTPLPIIPDERKKKKKPANIPKVH